jgi:indole-3-glycerol phosphate synthase
MRPISTGPPNWCSRYRAQLQLLLGVNCRDLVTLKVVPGGSRRSRPAAGGRPRVAESGIDSPAAAAASPPLAMRWRWSAAR